MRRDPDGYIKRVACQIYTQLPEDRREAMLVLQYVKQIIDCIGSGCELVQRQATIVPYPCALTDRGGFPAAAQEDQTAPPDISNPR